MTRSSTSAELSSVLINDVLCFVFNQHHVIPSTELSRICRDHFDSKAILTAKRILFEYCESSERCVNHRDAEKNVEDIINLLNSDKIDTGNMPVFAVADLSKLPSVLPYHVDSAQMLSIMRQLQSSLAASQAEMSAMRSEVLAVRQELKVVPSLRSELHEAKSELTKLTAKLADLPLREPPSREPSDVITSVLAESSSKPSSESSKTLNDNELSATAANYAGALGTNSVTSDVARKPSAGGHRVKLVVKDAKSESDSTRSDNLQWQVAKRRKPSVRLGTKPADRVHAVKSRRSVSIFASRISPDVSVNDVTALVKESFTSVDSVVKLTSRFETYASFKIVLSFEGLTFKQAMENALCETKWPEGILVRRFFEPKVSS